MDFSFGVPGCGAPEPVTFLDIFELNALLLIYSVCIDMDMCTVV